MSITNGTPKIVFGGINDQSRGTLVRGDITYAQHCPLLRLFTETGPSETTYVGDSSGSFASIYGSQTLGRRSKYHNLQSLLAEKLLAEGNGFYVKRLIPEDAPKQARVILALEIVEDLIPATIIELDGFNLPGQVDNVSLAADLPPVSGYRARLVTIKDNETAVGKQEILPGEMLAQADSTQSKIIPLFELPTSFFGEPGNLLGFRAWSPTLADSAPFDQATADLFETRMFRFQFMKKYTGATSPSIIKTAFDEDYVDVVFDEGVYSASTDKDFYAPQVLTQAYRDDGISSGLAPLYSPFSEIYVYAENIKLVQSMIFAKEVEVNPASALYLKKPGQIDFLTFLGIDGDAYQSVLLEGPLAGGIKLGQETVVYAQGGGDGTMNHATYEALVNKENQAFGELDDDYENIRLYQFSHIYDTGLSMEAKYLMMNVLGKRQDVKAVFTTYVEAEQRAPSKSEELSRAAALMARIAAFPESTIYGTPVCRAEIIQQTGYLMNGGYSKPVPQLIDYAVRWARYAGAGTGILRPERAIDESPNNRITEVKDLNVKFFNSRAQNAAWESGATYSLTYDSRSQYYPCIRSVYNDDTSVLLSPITVNICCDIMRLITLVHADFSGNSSLTEEQFIERSDKRINQLVGARYGERVNVIPTTYFTVDDKSNRFSWHCKVRVEASSPRTVMFFELETVNRDRVAEAAA